MSSLVISGDTSGTVSLTAAAIAGSNTITVQAATGTMSVNTLATAVASTSGTSIDFTALPSWVKRITVMFSGVSTSGTSPFLIQLGSGSITTSGYLSESAYINNAANSCTASAATTGLQINHDSSAAGVFGGNGVLSTLGSNIWTISGSINKNSGGIGFFAGTITLGGTLDRLRITTVGGTDTFDAGSVNILYEG